MTSRINLGWRILTTGLSFVLFGVGGTILAMVVFPLFNVMVRDRTRREAAAQITVQRVWRLYIRSMRFMGVLTYECRDEEILRAERGALIIANHPSLLDIVFLLAFVGRAQCVVKAGVWKNPFMKGVVRATNYIPNLGDPERLVDDCARALKEGNNVVLFPEGSRTVQGVPRQMQRGFAYVALESKAPIRLVTITCAPSTLMKGEPWHRVPATKPHWTIRVHDRIESPERSNDQRVSLAARELCTQIHNRIDELLLS